MNHVGIFSHSQRSQNVSHYVRERGPERAWRHQKQGKKYGVRPNAHTPPAQSCLYARTSQPAKGLGPKYLITIKSTTRLVDKKPQRYLSNANIQHHKCQSLELYHYLFRAAQEVPARYSGDK